MAENTNRSIFGFHGIFGGGIAVVGLLATLVFLTAWGISVQQHSATNPYDASVIRDLNNVKVHATTNQEFSFVDAKKDK